MNKKLNNSQAINNVRGRKTSETASRAGLTIIQNWHVLRASREGRKEIIYLMTQSTHFIYGYMASGIW